MGGFGVFVGLKLRSDVEQPRTCPGVHPDGRLVGATRSKHSEGHGQLFDRMADVRRQKNADLIVPDTSVSSTLHTLRAALPEEICTH